MTKWARTGVMIWCRNQAGRGCVEGAGKAARASSGVHTGDRPSLSIQLGCGGPTRSKRRGQLLELESAQQHTASAVSLSTGARTVTDSREPSNPGEPRALPPTRRYDGAGESGRGSAVARGSPPGAAGRGLPSRLRLAMPDDTAGCRSGRSLCRGAAPLTVGR